MLANLRSRTWASYAAMALAPALLVAGCGGSKTKTVTQTQTQTVEVPTTTKASSHLKLQLKQSVAKTGVESVKFTPSVTVKPGDEVAFMTEILNQTKAKGTKLELKINKAPNKTLTIEAGNAHRKPTASATLKSADGKPISLGAAKYKCVIAPTTFCPPDKAVDTGKAFDLVVNPPTTKGVPVVVTATVAQGG